MDVPGFYANWISTFFLTIFIASPTYAESLYITGLNSDQMILIDRDSIVWRGGNPRINEIWIFSSPRPTEGEFVQRFDSTMEYDCKGNRSRIFKSTIKTLDGRSIYTSEEPGNWIEVDKNNRINDIKFICRNEGDSFIDQIEDIEIAKRVYFTMLADGTFKNLEAGNK